MAERIMGIEIGSSNIKIVEVSKKAATLTVHKFSILSTPEESIKNGVINNVESIKKVIAQELFDRKYKAKKVVSVVQSTGIIIRNAIMEKQPEKIIRELLDMKTEDYLPVEKGQYQIDFKITREVEEGSTVKNELLLVAAPNNVVLPIAGLIKSLKLKPIMISIPSEALTNVFGNRRRLVFDSSPTVLVLDIGGNNTNATIVAQDQALLTRSIEFGVEDVNEALNSSVQNMGLLDKAIGNEELSDIIRPQIEYNIISEVERILQFYYSNFGNNGVKKIYLTGGGANVKGIRTYIRDALNIPTEKLNEFSTVIEAPDVEFEPYRRFFVNILGAINGL